MATPEARECGNRSIGTRVIGGTDATRCEFPWQVPVYVDNFLCGGTIVDATTIVTAAHCLEPPDQYSASDIQVDVSEHDFLDNTDQITVPVESFVVHPDYDTVTLQNDIAIIKLKVPIEFGDCAAPLCLPSADQDFTGLNCEVSGWGETIEGGPIADVLQTTTLPIISWQDCRSVLETDDVTDKNICAGVDEGGKDTCAGDSGGPLACPSGNYWVLAGVVSWGYGCAQPNTPGVYTNVAGYLDWIAVNS